MSSEYNWRIFTKRINIKSPVQAVYQAWTTRSALEKWFLRLAEFQKPSGELLNNETAIQEDDTYKWLWHGYGDDTAEHGEILAANGTDFLKFRFGKAGNVTVELTVEEGETIVSLTQDEIPDDEKGKVNFHIGCGEGWTFYLANLKSFLEGGIDLRNKNAHIRRVINS